MPCASPSSGDAFSLGLSSHLCPLGATAKAGCSKPDRSKAHAPLPASRLDMRACHPASRNWMTEFFDRGFDAPLPRVLGAGPDCLVRQSYQAKSRVRFSGRTASRPQNRGLPTQESYDGRYNSMLNFACRSPKIRPNSGQNACVVGGCFVRCPLQSVRQNRMKMTSPARCRGDLLNSVPSAILSMV